VKIATIRLHESSNAESLALARILIFTIWLIYIVPDPIESIVYFSPELFNTYGVYAWLPSELWGWIITPLGLLTLKTILIGLGVWGLLGLPGSKWVTALFVVAVLTYLQLKKGFGGHWDHRELTLVYVTALLGITPAWDSFAVYRRNFKKPPVEIYRASLIVLSLIVVLQYFFIGAARLFIGGPGVFLNGTLQKWIEHRNLRPNQLGWDFSSLLQGPIWGGVLDSFFLAGTLLELAAVLLLFFRPGPIKYFILLGFAGFHASILFSWACLFQRT
jgi:hypothetical protein